MNDVIGAVDLGVRALALAGVAFAAVIAGTHWAARRRVLRPFGAWSRGVRKISDPVLRPIERRLARRGGNPQDATLWLLGIAVLAGLLLITLARWLTGVLLTLIRLGDASPRTWLAVATDWAFGLVMLALFVRVVGSWLGAGPYTRWMRPFYWLTDWMVNPIRRVLPAVGVFDLSPLVAYLLLLLLRGLVVGAIG
jgi:YggT family protein